MKKVKWFAFWIGLLSVGLLLGFLLPVLTTASTREVSFQRSRAPLEPGFPETPIPMNRSSERIPRSLL